MEKKTMGSFITVLRKAKGMTQRELAELLNVSDKAISRWERDESMPDIILIPILADIFEVSCDELLRGERCKEPSFMETEDKRRKRMHALFQNRKSRFEAFSLISAALTILGIISAMVCNFVFHKALIGFFAATAWFVCAIVAQMVVYRLYRGTVETQEFFDEDEGVYRKELFQKTRHYLYFIIIIWGICLPLLLFGKVSYADYYEMIMGHVLSNGMDNLTNTAEATIQIGLQLKTWVLYGSLCGCGAFIGCLATESFIKRKENKPLFVLSLALGSTLVLAVLFQVHAPKIFTEYTTFKTFEEFEIFMETPSEGMTQNEIGRQMAQEPVKILSDDGEVLYQYMHINLDVKEIKYGDKDKLPIHVCTVQDYKMAERIVNWLLVLWIAIGIAECIYVPRYYRKKQACK